MQLFFNCFCSTQWGQQLFISGSTKELGSWDINKAIPLTCISLNQWKAMVEFKSSTKHFTYKFFIKDGASQQVHWENGKNHSFTKNTARFKQYNLLDFWQTPAKESDTWKSSAFTKVIFKRETEDIKRYALPPKTNEIIEITVNAPIISKDSYLAISGNTEKLGNWDVNKATPMNASDFPVWKIALDAASIDHDIEYKFVIINKSNNTFEWEKGQNRRINKQEIIKNTYTKISENDFKYETPKIKGAGISIPVFSLKSKTSFGVGDFTDLTKLVDWADKTSMRMIQLLPINDTISTKSFLDSYPYKAISVFALHPLFLNIFKMGKLKDAKILKEYESLQKELNKNEKVEYTSIIAYKLKYAELLFEEQKSTFLKKKTYLNFFEANKEWLIPYAAFSYLRDENKTSNFNDWTKHAKYNKEQIETLCNEKSKAYDKIAFWYFVQFHLDQQLKAACDYGRKKNIVFKGDIPIGISRNSVDAWAEPELYHFDGQAGAPPDDFSIDGQNWGFPTYNWQVMEQDNYAWWRKRLRKMAEYFDAYRIDHILGFFRIWEIPTDAVQGILGYFRPSLPFHTNELNERGVWMDYDRLCKPYIRGHFLYDIFGYLTEDIIQNYLTETEYQVYELKSDFDTQRKVYEHFVDENGPESLSEDDAIRYNGLIQLIADVVLIPAKNQNDFYHPRISFHNTHSYKELEEHQKHVLNELYIDYFYHRHETFWKQEAIKKLPALVDATDMLICGEDLGMIPASVPDVMNKFNILSLEIQRMPKDPTLTFAHPANAPYLSVCTTSTHDMSTIRGWWEEDKAKTQMFFNQEMGQWGEAPYYAEPWICEDVIKQHVHSPAMWTIFPVQDLLAMDAKLRLDDTHAERINVPANPRHYWQYRMHLSLEELLKEKSFNELLVKLVRDSGRKIE